MARLNLAAIEDRMKPLGKRVNYDKEIIFDLLGAYGKPKSTISRLRSGNLNVAEDPTHEIALKNTIYFKEIEPGENTLATLDELRTAAHVKRFTPRFVLVTDYRELLAADTKTGETLATPIAQIDEKFTFFLPWAGMEKAQYTSEAHADVKAAEKMGKLFDELISANPHVTSSAHDRHMLNVFFTRLLFCFFAEDTGIFTDNLFTNAVSSYTQKDGSDAQEFLTAVFDALDTANPDDKSGVVADFPYVNGRLFSRSVDGLVVPQFTSSARQALIELGTLQWQEINPDIFGSMFQAIVTPGQRSDLGQHYTSVPNILKTIEPLFLDELREEFDAAFDNVKKLEKLLDRISEIKIFDPACGSGNFLIIAYKELRRLEHSILEQLHTIGGNKYGFAFHDSRISIENFFGIEIDDFAVEVAMLSLWIAKHQMNREFYDKFSVSIPLIPLKEHGKIVVGNATRLDWNRVCPNNRIDEIYLIGNPPYVGSSMQTKDQKQDFPYVFGARPFSKKLDYIALWFVKGADYICDSRSKLAFVSTNSITQGDLVGLFFPHILNCDVEIDFAYSSFKWENNAKKNAGVTVVVIGLRNISNKSKYIFADGLITQVENINGYLMGGRNLLVSARKKPISHQLPLMRRGNMPVDGGHLALSAKETPIFIDKHPECVPFLKNFYGSDNFIKGIDRVCIWIDERNLEDAKNIDEIQRRLKLVSQARSESKDSGARRIADVPWKFREQVTGAAVVVPSITSDNRDYIPVGFVDNNSIVSNTMYTLYGAEIWILALLISRVHMSWVNMVAGRFETRYI
ncbi:DNA methyltransferase, partial [Rothia sp. LK2492]|uniref:DNA methyltransferase n=1 Tax=Rothia sp. LK2492 TaxID=3114370 RepID=UPI0034CF8D54